ncbi:HlyD family efflux transporter periplasmic adaptor subunit [Pontibacter sp. FD36]|uniref:HlyD family secretion protein n=1 Tax=Pontibacter sp. FD36 TaxID=2789860 RepID=UPI0018AB8AEF|nr:HlyD family efflux transporter periplasmic adaptor subunit [Pontibacter sp. FD36]MBF8964379.1 HlyD family efflux transporter periplasmic adaptor subunit [Pontibacter sp. FD36]
MKTIFPSAIIEQSTECYQSRITVRSKIIYLSALAFLFLALLCLPFIYIDLSIQAKGILQSSLERNEVFVPVQGRVYNIRYKENDKVSKGDVIAEIVSEQLNLELQGYQQRIGLLNTFLSDLRTLGNKNITTTPPSFKSDVYAASYYEYFSAYESLKAVLDKATRDYERNALLYEAKAIAFVEYDESKLKYEQAQSNLELHIKKQKAKWKQEANSYANELNQLENKVKSVTEQKTHYKILAGVNGTLLNVKNIKEGDFVFPNQKIAEISPDSTLLAVAYISPKDVGFIQPGQQVSLQVDAFNYNDWGFAKGKVAEIADDLSLISEQQAAFRVICSLDQTHLKLKNGYTGELRKGMTFNGRFLVARRSLFQLLYDKVDDWMNPAITTI